MIAHSSTDDTGGIAGMDNAAGPDDQPVGTVTVELDGAALAVARSAAVAEAGDPTLVGDAVDVYAEDSVAVSARFQALMPGYRGWLWSVTIVLLERPERGDVADASEGTGTADSVLADGPSCTVSEVVLLPGPDALLAPAWVPWEQRIRSGDLGVGDLLPPHPDDPRLVPGYLLSDDPAVEQVCHELGIGRVRVMSREGREDAAERWHSGPYGPGDEMALHAPGHCVSCGFYLPLAGSLGGGFGACGNDLSPADGRVVDSGYGCGAHSEAIGTPRARSAVTDTVIDELRLEVHARTTPDPAEAEGPDSAEVQAEDRTDRVVADPDLAAPPAEQPAADRDGAEQPGADRDGDDGGDGDRPTDLAPEQE